MAKEVRLSGIKNFRLLEALRQSLMQEQPNVVAIASAFVSTTGVRQVHEIFRRCGEPRCWLVAGTDNAITHPEALFAARGWGWRVRLGNSTRGIFHPKLIVAGRQISRNGYVRELNSVYVGSSNLTDGGLSTNVECGVMVRGADCPESAAQAFAELWSAGSTASAVALRDYAARFAEHSRRRSASELAGLGVSDSWAIPEGPSELQVLQEPLRPALSTDFAVAAWTGLQSFTGEYRFQVEFPKLAGRVVRQLVGARMRADGRIEIYCPDDRRTRQMQYRFYENNGMFRLNVPNDTPGVLWAREHKEGIAIVEQGLPGGAPLRVRILRSGSDTREIVGHSAALGTWGKTPTRVYGWW
jgi:hypothetical protein